MSRRALEVGAFVHCAGLDGRTATEATYRVEQRMKLDDGGTLYKISSDSEPFDRVVGERQLIRNPLISQT